MTDKARSQQRFPTEEYRKGWEEAFAKPWRMCDFCGMTREKTSTRVTDTVLPMTSARPLNSPWAMTICAKCEARIDTTPLSFGSEPPRED